MTEWGRQIGYACAHPFRTFVKTAEGRHAFGVMLMMGVAEGADTTDFVTHKDWVLYTLTSAFCIGYAAVAAAIRIKDIQLPVAQPIETEAVPALLSAETVFEPEL